MKYFTQRHGHKLINGFRRLWSRKKGPGLDPYPVTKLFTLDGRCIWLLSEMDPRNENIAFGLCDLDYEGPWPGYVRLPELSALRGRLGLPVERDDGFKARKTLSQYAAEARNKGRIRGKGLRI